MAVTLLMLSRFKKYFFSLSDFPVNLQQRIYLKIPPHLICVATLLCKTLLSENERQSQTNAVINDNLQGTVVTYLCVLEFSIIKLSKVFR